MSKFTQLDAIKLCYNLLSLSIQAYANDLTSVEYIKTHTFKCYSKSKLQYLNNDIYRFERFIKSDYCQYLCERTDYGLYLQVANKLKTLNAKERSKVVAKLDKILYKDIMGVFDYGNLSL